MFQALCGARAEIPLLGGERMVVNLQDEVVQPNTVKRIVGKGLPNPKDVNRKGDLIVNFDIQFPERLSDHLKDLFRKYLPGWKKISIIKKTLDFTKEEKLTIFWFMIHYWCYKENLYL